MGRIVRIKHHEHYEDLRRVGNSLNENNDCSVIALALVTGQDYRTIHEMLAKLGREPRHGTRRIWHWSVLQQLGVNYETKKPTEIKHRYPGRLATELKTVTTMHPRRFPGVFLPDEKWLLFTARHVAAVVDGVNKDWSVNTPLPVQLLVRIVQ